MGKNELRGETIGMPIEESDADIPEESGPGLKKAHVDVGTIVGDVRTTLHKLRRQPPATLQQSQFFSETPVGAEFRIIRERHRRRKAEEAARQEQERIGVTRGDDADGAGRGPRPKTKYASTIPSAPYVARPRKAERELTPFEERVLELFNESENLFDNYTWDLREQPETSSHITERYQREKIALFQRYFLSLTSEDMTAKNVATLLRAWLRIHFRHAGPGGNLRLSAESLITLRKEGRKTDDVLRAISSHVRAPAIEDSRQMYESPLGSVNPVDPDFDLRYIGPDLNGPRRFSEESETDLPEYEPPEDLD